MKKLFILTVLSGMILLSGCSNNISNIDVQKLNVKATQYMEAGEYDKAVARLEAIIDLNPEFYETYYNLGVAYYQMNDYEKAINALNQAIEKKDNFADAYYSRAVVYEDWAYSILEGEDNDITKDNAKKTTADDKVTSMKYLQNAKADFEKYLDLKKNAEDKDEVHEKIIQIENDLNNGEQQGDNE